MYDILELNKKLVSDLREIAKELQIKKVESLKKQDLIYKILDQQAINATTEVKNQKRNQYTKKRIQIKVKNTECRNLSVEKSHKKEWNEKELAR